jgi:hypothetical protein
MLHDGMVAMLAVSLASASWAALLALGILAALALGWPRLAGSTLRAPWCWSVIAIAAVTGAEVFIGLQVGPSAESDWTVAVRYTVAMTTLLPIMAVLGAKRPQDRGWQFIVASLWVILSLPSGQWWLLGGGRWLVVPTAWKWFLALLIGVQVGNYLPTRHWLTSLFVATAQTLVLWEWLPGVEWKILTLPAYQLRVSIALALTLVAAWLVMIRPPIRSRQQAAVTGQLSDVMSGHGSDLDRVWLDFRDLFGTVWALRILERVNATSRLSDWPVDLSWSGFCAKQSEESKSIAMPSIPPATHTAIVETLRTLLRRFVSPAWIDRRLT